MLRRLKGLFAPAPVELAPVENVRFARPTAAPAPLPPLDPRSWAAFKRQRGRVPYLRPGEGEAVALAGHVHRQAEQEQQRARLEGELSAERARVDAGVEPVQPPAGTSLEGFTGQQF